MTDVDPETRALDGETEQRRLAAVRRYNILDTPPEGAFDRVCALAARSLTVPIATVTIVDEDRIWFKACQGLRGVTEIGRDPGLCSSAILGDTPYVVTDAATDPRALNNPLVRGELGLRFYAAAPLITDDGHRLGTLNVMDTVPRQVDGEELDTLTDLAAMVMDHLQLRLSALQTVQHVQRERHDVEDIAETLRQSLLPPQLPTIPGVEVSAYYRAASPSEVVGDFYDVFPLDARRWGWFVGDVCGKGPSAARLTALARHTLRAAAILGEDPAAVLSDLNTAMLLERGREDARFCTVVYGELAAGDGHGVRITLANGGHPPCYILRSGDALTRIHRTGPLVGVLDDATYTSVTVDLRPGDAIVFYTDGITEARPGGTTFGEDGLVALLDECRKMPAGELIAYLRESLDRFEPPPRDDTALLALSVPG